MVSSSQHELEVREVREILIEPRRNRHRTFLSSSVERPVDPELLNNKGSTARLDLDNGVRDPR
jgi:hypothetical protein